MGRRGSMGPILISDLLSLPVKLFDLSVKTVISSPAGPSPHVQDPDHAAAVTSPDRIDSDRGGFIDRTRRAGYRSRPHARRQEGLGMGEDVDRRSIRAKAGTRG